MFELEKYNTPHTTIDLQAICNIERTQEVLNFSNNVDFFKIEQFAEEQYEQLNLENNEGNTSDLTLLNSTGESLDLNILQNTPFRVFDLLYNKSCNHLDDSALNQKTEKTADSVNYLLQSNKRKYDKDDNIDQTTCKKPKTDNDIFQDFNFISSEDPGIDIPSNKANIDFPYFDSNDISHIIQSSFDPILYSDE
jgi:hypothetical protein